jgi:DNA replication protein DnaC
LTSPADPLPDCIHCRKPVTEADVARAPRLVGHLPRMVSHSDCAEQARAAHEEKRRLDDIERRTRQVSDDFWRHLEKTSPPRWEHARFDNAEFRRRALKKVVTAVERWNHQQGCLLVSAPTGAGKTASALAWLFQLRDGVISRIRAGDAASLPSFAFVTGHELANCRRRAPIGDEAPLIALAKRVEILVLDDLGAEPFPNEELNDVLDHRFRTERRSLVTTGLSVAAFRARYRGAIYRRLIEPGDVVEVTR